MNNNSEEQRLDLLIKHATVGLTEDEARQLETFGPDHDDLASFELTAAALSMIDLDASENMPAELLKRIAADAHNYIGERSAPLVNDAEPEDVPAVRGIITPVTTPVRSLFDWFGWAVATAALVALAFNLYYTRVGNTPQIAQGPASTPEVAVKLTPAQERDRLIASANDLVKAEWKGGKDFPDLKGDVVWSDSTQTGYIRVTGLKANDPNKETYQIWLFAANQDKKTPVNGGTFDSSTDGEIIVPINAEVKTIEPRRVCGYR